MTEQDKYTRWLLGEAQKGRMSRREFLGRSSAVGISLAIGTGLFNEAYAATPKKGGHMRMAMGHGATTDTLDPATLTNGLQWVVAYGVANTLTELDASGALVGSLALNGHPRQMLPPGRSSCVKGLNSIMARR